MATTRTQGTKTQRAQAGNGAHALPGLNIPARLPRMDDAALVEQCRAGDEGAWRELVERYSRYVYAIMSRGYRLDHEAAEDVFQEVFARTYERLGELRDPGALRPWIAQMTRRLAIDHLRADREIPGLEEAQVPEATEDPIAELDSALSVQQMLGTLPEQFREVLDRYFCRGESYETIASELEISGGTVASRISRGLEKLRATLEADGYTANGLEGGSNGSRAGARAAI